MRFDRIAAGDSCNRDDPLRIGVMLLCEVRQGTRPWARVRLEDISPSGFRIAWMPSVDPERPLRVRIPGLQVLTAHVRWQRGKAIGCEFAETLHLAVFEHIVKESGAL
ncbi:MAG TPA: PilZ domain-containing protein [Novosphingobium sp.]|nr:PilZ domain-containing protein [Novosphingobium sp.]